MNDLCGMVTIETLWSVAWGLLIAGCLAGMGLGWMFSRREINSIAAQSDMEVAKLQSLGANADSIAMSEIKDSSIYIRVRKCVIPSVRIYANTTSLAEYIRFVKEVVIAQGHAPESVETSQIVYLISQSIPYRDFLDTEDLDVLIEQYTDAEMMAIERFTNIQEQKLNEFSYFDKPEMPDRSGENYA